MRIKILNAAGNWETLRGDCGHEDWEQTDSWDNKTAFSCTRCEEPGPWIKNKEWRYEGNTKPAISSFLTSRFLGFRPS